MLTALKTEHGYLATFPYGDWIVDGKPIHVKTGSAEINFTDPEVRKVAETYINTHYEDAEGNKLTLDDYRDTVAGLTADAEYDDDGPQFHDLDAEFAYRKFRMQWTAVRKHVTTLSDPVLIHVAEVEVDTGNPYIKAVLSTKRIDNGLYVYNRESAVNNIIRSKFADLGMVRHDVIRYEATKDNKVWGKSHGNLGVTSIVAFGGYLFSGDKYKNMSDTRGSLDMMRAAYNLDKHNIESLIDVNFNLHFMHGEVSINLESLYHSITALRTKVTNIEPKQKSYDNKRNALNAISAIVEKLDKEITSNATR